MQRWSRKINGGKQFVSSFDWYKCLLKANMAKFGENSSLRQRLLESRGKLLVEANPCSSDFGIGLSATHVHATVQAKWLGANWYGYSLTDAREQLLEVSGIVPSYAVTWTWESLCANPRSKLSARHRGTQRYHPSMIAGNTSVQARARSGWRTVNGQPN